MSMLTQRVVVCSSCKAEHELGQFSCDDWWTFSKQIEMMKLEPELQMLTRIDALFERYPELRTLIRQDWQLWRDPKAADDADDADDVNDLHDNHDAKCMHDPNALDVVDWIRARIPDSINWSLSDSDREVLNYVDLHYTENQKDSVKRKRSDLVSKILERASRCPSCGAYTLYIAHERLDPVYAEEMGKWGNQKPGPIWNELASLLFSVLWVLFMLTCCKDVLTGITTLPFLVAALGVVFAFFEVVFALVGLLLAYVSCTSIASFFVARRLLAKTPSDPLFRRDGIFGGTFKIDGSKRHFEWIVGGKLPARHCTLICPDKANWTWISEVVNEAHPVAKDTTAVWELEFKGTFLAARPSSVDRGHYLLEISDLISTKLVSVDYSGGASLNLLRPSSAKGTIVAQDVLLRPTLGREEETQPHELLRAQNRP